MRTCLRKTGILAAAILLAALCTIGCKTEVITSDPLPESFTVEVTAGEHGIVNANASGKVTQGTVITFIAFPKIGYQIDKWTITGGSFEEGGTPGSPTAKVTITADTKVNVSFTPATYAEVPFGTNGADLNKYLKTAVPDIIGICYIKVNGLTAADLKRNVASPFEPGALGKILKDNPTKKVALKLEEIPGLTDMTNCFFDCKSLIQAPVIPAGVTDMSYCFYGCESLTQAPVIPAGVTDMVSCFYYCKSLTQAPVIPAGVTDMRDCFSGCKNITVVTLKCDYVEDNKFDCAFRGCEKLTAGSIKVPAAQLQTYKDHAELMNAAPDWFIADE